MERRCPSVCARGLAGAGLRPRDDARAVEGGHVPEKVIKLIGAPGGESEGARGVDGSTEDATGIGGGRQEGAPGARCGVTKGPTGGRQEVALDGGKTHKEKEPSRTSAAGEDLVPWRLSDPGLQRRGCEGEARRSAGRSERATSASPHSQAQRWPR